MEIKPVQLAKQYEPIDVTESGIVMEIKPVQPSKQYEPIDVTELGIMMEVKNSQFWKLLLSRELQVVPNSRRANSWPNEYDSAVILEDSVVSITLFAFIKKVGVNKSVDSNSYSQLLPSGLGSVK